MTAVLDAILAATREEVARRRDAVPLAELRIARTLDGRRRFMAAIERPGISLIAEHKRRSPSAGPIREGASVRDIVVAYERGGAAALSILTDGPHFGGSLEDLRAARTACSLPILRKDFIVDAYQLHESAAASADAILLIVAALSDAQLAELHALALDLGLAALVEVHDDLELERAAGVGASLIGINNRDLRTMGVDPDRALRLLGRVPDDVPTVVESGLRDRAQLDQVGAAGADAVLVGEALMRAPDIEAACRALTGGPG